MPKYAKNDIPATTDDTGSYTVGIYSGDNGRLISEFALETQYDHVNNIAEAEHTARERIKHCDFSDTVLVITEEGPTEFNQVQLRVPRTASKPA